MLDVANIMLLLPAFALVLMRVSGMMLAAPIFSSVTVPRRVKVALAVAVTVVIFPMVRPSIGDLPPTLLGTAAMAVGELAVGLVIGLAVMMLFVAMQLAGQAIDQQMGLGLARVFNPMFESEVGVVSQLYLLIATALLLILNGHHLIVGGVIDSFRAMPPGQVTLQPEMLSVVRGLLAGSYAMALKVSAPVIVVLFLVSVMMGFLGRTVPQINILVVGFPLRIGIGLVALVMTIGVMLVIFSSGYRRMVDAVGELIRSLGA